MALHLQVIDILKMKRDVTVAIAATVAIHSKIMAFVLELWHVFIE